MCLTIPAKVLSIEGSGSPVQRITVRDSRGVKPLQAIMLDDLAVGDWVLYTSDAAVRKMSEEDAMEILALLEPKQHIDPSALDGEFVRLLGDISRRTPTRKEVVRLLDTGDPLEMEALFAEANTVRQANLRDFFCIHGIVEFSSHCVNDCHYCGLRKSAVPMKRYRMTPGEIVQTATEAVESRGYKLIVLQSGDDPRYSVGMLEEIIKEIKARCRVFLFMSVGERSLEDYRRMKEAGASGVLFRFETSNERIYNRLHPGQSLEKRMELLRGMKELGYYIASGFLVGLPGQRLEDMADDILFMKDIGVNMATIGPFVPCEDTPMADLAHGDAMLTLRITAVLRLLMPKVKIPVTTALETIESEEGRRLGLSSGANSLMFNLTPERYRGDYRLYPNKYHGNESVWEKYGLYREELSYSMLEKKMREALETTL